MTLADLIRESKRLLPADLQRELLVYDGKSYRTIDALTTTPEDDPECDVDSPVIILADKPFNERLNCNDRA